MRRVVVSTELLDRVRSCDSAQSSVALDSEAARYVARVLRLRPPTEILLIDGQGAHVHATLVATTKDSACVVRSSNNPPLPHVESPLSVHLGVGLPKGERWEWVIQKCTELGVVSIIPLLTEHTQVHIPPKKAQDRLTRWNSIALQAVRQSQRLRTPKLFAPVSLQEALALPCVRESDARLFAHLSPPNTPNPLRSAEAPRSLTIFLGPEGGWSNNEASFLDAQGWSALPLGPRTLRVETAAVAVCSIAQFLCGDLSHAHSPS